MFKRRSKEENVRLDALGRDVIRSAALDTAETRYSASYNRVRLAIETEKTARRQTTVAPVLQILAMGRFKVELAALAVFAAVCFWVVRIHPPTPAAQLYPAPRVAGVGGFSPEKLTACSISSKDKCVISTEDVLQLLVSRKLQEQGK